MAGPAAQLSRPHGRRRGSPTFSRRLGLSLVAVAILPLLAFGAYSVFRVEDALGTDADMRIDTALAAVEDVLARHQVDLADATEAYATWSVTSGLIEDASLDALRTDILGFLVGNGTVDVAVAIVDGQPVAVGPAEIVAAVTPAADASRTDHLVMAVDGGLYLVATAPVGVAATGDRLVFVRRLDAGFVHEVRRLTGFDVAIVLPGGIVSVASDPDAANLFARRSTTGTGPVTKDGVLAGWIDAPASGGSAATLLVTDRQAPIQTLVGQLPAVLLVSLLVAGSFAIVAAWFLGRGLTRRLAAVHDGLAAMAAGRRPTAPSLTNDADVVRLAAALQALVNATDRRDRILSETSMSIAGMRPELGYASVAASATASALSLFDLERCSLVDADGGAVAAAGRPPRPGDGDVRVLEAPVEVGSERPFWLIGLAASTTRPDESDAALFGLYARLVGGVLIDSRAHDEAAEQMARLGRRSELQREFLRSVSHNLQTPLATISLLADDLGQPDAVGSVDFVSTRATAIRTEADRLDRLVRQLLTVSRLDAGRVRLEQEPISVAPLIRRVWAELASKRALEVDDAATDLIAVGDRDAIEQIAWILLDNAIRYAPDGPIMVRTGRAGSSNAPKITVAVEDHGPGIPAIERRNIFRRFWRGSAGQQRGGSGIGLDIARRLARAMGGSMSYRPGGTGGSTFVLTIPAEPAHRD